MENLIVYLGKFSRCNMSKRITILIDEDLDKKLRSLQAKLILETSSSISYSQIINDTLRKSIKK